ncbi:MAG TPA: hypothetical protein VN711_02965 [Candidatus Saccharimonadales bacterium]|nr:hypothetical protein [Candidatus Saccharimonadales bacterium]
MLKKVFLSKLHHIFSQHILRKVPQITLFFWIIKLLTTAMGESTSDFLVHHIDPVFAVMIGFAGFALVILLQFWTKKYIPWIYWLAVSMVAIFGTMAADVIHIVLGIPYFVSTIFFAAVLACVFTLWYKIEKTLSIHSIITTRRELFYWVAVITTFALGTATGDMTAVTFNLGYLGSGVLFAVLFILPLLMQKLAPSNEVLTFWIAYIFTRPLGASFADWLGRTPDAGGIGFGTGKTSIVLAIFIIMLVGYLSSLNFLKYNEKRHERDKN